MVASIVDIKHTLTTATTPFEHTHCTTSKYRRQAAGRMRESPTHSTWYATRSRQSQSGPTTGSRGRHSRHSCHSRRVRSATCAGYGGEGSRGTCWTWPFWCDLAVGGCARVRRQRKKVFFIGKRVQQAFPISCPMCSSDLQPFDGALLNTLPLDVYQTCKASSRSIKIGTKQFIIHLNLVIIDYCFIFL